MGIKTLIHLLRHGETEGGAGFYGSTDNPLTNRGWTQMWAAVQNKASHCDRIITSPLKRCADFSRRLSNLHAIPLEIDTRIRELHFGAWEGRSSAELMAIDADSLTRFWENPVQHTPPGAESISNFEARVLSAWHDININHTGKTLLLVAHGGTIRVILCHILQRPIERLLELEVAHAALIQIQAVHADGDIHYSFDEESGI